MTTKISATAISPNRFEETKNFADSLKSASGDNDDKKLDQKALLERRTKIEQETIKEDPALGKYITRYGIRIYLKYQMKPCDNLSNNCNQRPIDKTTGAPTIDGVLTHNTVVPFDEALKIFNKGDVYQKKNPDGSLKFNADNSPAMDRNGTSTNYIIDKNGNVFLIADEEERAWHAGAGSFNAKEKGNDHLLGVEIEGGGPPTTNELTDDCSQATNFKEQPSFYPKQIEAFRKLSVGMKGFWNIADKDFAYHSDYKFYDPKHVGNRCDPGAAFPSKKLADGKRGALPWKWFSKTDKVGLWPDKVAVDPKGTVSRYGQSDAQTANGRAISDDQKLLLNAGFSKIAARDDKGALIKGSDGELTVSGIYDDVTKNAVIAFMLHYMPDSDFNSDQITPQMRALLQGLIKARQRDDKKAASR